MSDEALVVVRRGAEVLVVHRVPEDGGYWHVVAGGVEPGEADADAARRELEEETGLVAELRPETYAFSYRGVSVACFCADAPPGWEPRLNHEHDDHRWCTVAEARRLMRWQDAADAVAALAD